VTATMERCSREYPTAERQVTHTEFSKKSPAPQTSHWKARTIVHSASRPLPRQSKGLAS
jgi:hypothetical protein